LFVFKDTVTNVSVEGQKNLGAVIGSREFLQDYVNEKVNRSCSVCRICTRLTTGQLCRLHVRFKTSLDVLPKNCPWYPRFFRATWRGYFPGLIPAIEERKCRKLDRDVLALPVSPGGLGLSNLCDEAASEYASSIQVPYIFLVIYVHEQRKQHFS